MKVNLGRQTGQKYLHKLPSSVTTTSQFGFVQPFYCRESIAQDHYKIRQAAAVRLQPVVKPTFGRLFLKEYTSFVPMEEIYHPWGSLLDGKPFAGANATYIPGSVPWLPLNVISGLALLMSEISLFIVDSDGSLDDYRVGGREAYSSSFSIDTIDSYFSGIGLPSFFERLSRFSYSKGYTTLNIVEDIRFVDVQGKFDWIIPFDNGSISLLCGRFSNRGKNFYKLLVGLGYQFCFSEDYKTILPFVAYYKQYFDLFQPQRNITWKETNVYSFMEYIEQSNVSVMSILAGNLELGPAVPLLDFFFKDLTEAYYTQDVDFAAAHIDGLGVSQDNTSVDYLRDNNGDIVSDDVLSGQNSQPIITANGISQSALDILKAMYQRVNISTALGGKIKEFMQVIFGSDYNQDDESFFVGSNTVPIDITDVMSTAETSEGYLGEFAGKGIGFDPAGKPLEYTCRSAGYMISCFAIIPEARLCQAVDPNLGHLSKMDFFQSKFDALTLLPTRKSAIMGQQDVIFSTPSSQLKDGFGNIPNYTEYKVSFDKLNGEVSMRSTRDQLLPFSMSKYISPSYSQIWPDSQPDGSFNISVPETSIFTNGLIWRYIGLDNWLGNFNRIFVNQGFNELNPENPSPISTGTERDIMDNVDFRMDDNFIVYLYSDISVSSFAKPLADSFQTDSFGDHISVQKQ